MNQVIMNGNTAVKVAKVDQLPPWARHTPSAKWAEWAGFKLRPTDTFGVYCYNLNRYIHVNNIAKEMSGYLAAELLELEPVTISRTWERTLHALTMTDYVVMDVAHQTKHRREVRGVLRARRLIVGRRMFAVGIIRYEDETVYEALLMNRILSQWGDWLRVMTKAEIDRNLDGFMVAQSTGGH